MVGALVLLMAGTVLVQEPHLGQPPADLGTLGLSSDRFGKPRLLISADLRPISAHLEQEPPAKGGGGADSSAGMMVGIGATVAACVCSSVASVYLEKILIESKPSIWVRNAQLCLFTIPIAAVGTQMVKDDYLKEEGTRARGEAFAARAPPGLKNESLRRQSGTPIHGFTFAVWASIVTNAAGGMIVAVVMKFAGNILRNFAQACAIVVGGIGLCP